MNSISFKVNHLSFVYHLYPLIIVFFTSTCFIQAQSPLWQNCLSNEDVRDIKSDANNIWIATTGGLIQLNDQLEEIARYTSLNSGLACNQIQEIEVDGEGIVWINHCYGLSSFDGSTFVDYDIDISKMVLDNDQNVFLVSNSGYNSWNGSDFDFTALESTIQYLSIGDVYVESNEVIWISKATFGIFQIHRFENGQLTVFDYSNSELPFEYPWNAIFVKGIDNKLAIALGKTVFVFDGTTWKQESMTDMSIVDVQVLENGDVFALLIGYIDGSLITFIGQLSEEYEILLENLQVIEGKYPQTFSISEANTLVGFLETGLHLVQDDDVSKINLTETALISNSINSLNVVDEKIWIQNGRSEYDRVGSILTFDDFVWEEKKAVLLFLKQIISI
jgi:hypothetical protein